MKLGYLTAYTPHEGPRAQRLGFDCLEIQSTSWSGPEVYGDKKQREQILDDLARTREEFGVSVSAIAHYHASLKLRGKEQTDSFRKAIDIAQTCGAGVVSTIPPREQRDQPLAENVASYKKSFGPVARMAEDAGVKIAFENWPAFMGYPLSGMTMAYSPEAWELLFDAVPSKAMGLEFDPSHLYWQGIDHMAALRKFADRVHHVHAKDTEIFYETRNRVGVFGDGWWTYRIPGLGEINWPQFIAGLYSIGYAGGVCIEHEDIRFDPGRKEPNLAAYEQGLRLGHACLRPLIQ